MKTYYKGWHARFYDTIWRKYTACTLRAVITMIDFVALQQVAEQYGRLPRVLDAACGTGVLLKLLSERIPSFEGYGVDASADMLQQAEQALRSNPYVSFQQAVLGAGESPNLPYSPGMFDLIVCTNALHYFAEPEKTLAGLGHLLAKEGQFVVEDFARRSAPFPWESFAWLMRWVDPGYVRAYTLSEARDICEKGQLRVMQERDVKVDWLWRAWVLRLQKIYESDHEPSPPHG
jgi:ubiquinone/menaquinone biosynthesis C-methylase UbiE